MKKNPPGKKAVAPTRATAPKKVAAKAVKKKTQKTQKTPDAPALTSAKALEALDAAEPKTGKATPAKSASRAAAQPLRNADFPRTYIKSIHVSLNDPDHWMTLTWTGPQAAQQEKGPFRTSPGAGAKGLNCDNTATSRRSGTKCTPKGTHTVEGFQARLNSDSRATFVTWFVRWRGIAFHYFPSVPAYAASHGCVRIEAKRVAQLLQENSRIDLTKVVIDGTWTKPARQW